MRIDLTVDVFSDPESLLPILTILECFAVGHHEWHASPQSIEAAKRYLSENAPKLTQTYVQLGEKAMVGATWNVSSGTRTIIVSQSDLDHAVKDLSRAAVLVVENATSDGNFIRAIATVFQSTRIIRALDEDWLTIRHAGGSGELKVTAEHEHKKFNLHVRIVVLFDSDGMTPEHETHNHRVAKALESAGITAHVLQLREAENYVPHRVLASSSPQREISAKLKHFKLLSPAQRGHFDMKDGFPKDKHGPRVPPIQEELFTNVPPATLRYLCGGFGRDLLRLLADQVDAITPEDFARISTEVEIELRDLLSKIEAVI